MKNLLTKELKLKEKALQLKYREGKLFSMKTIQQKIIYVEKASRIEMLFRIIWGIVAGIVLGIFSLIAIFAIVIHFFYILIYGKRQRGIFDLVKAIEVQRFRLVFYLTFETDERPPIVPEMNV